MFPEPRMEALDDGPSWAWVIVGAGVLFALLLATL